MPGGLLPGEDVCVATPPPAPGSGDGAVRDGAGGTGQVDWGSFSYVDERGRKRRMWAFVMVLSWSRAIYVEFVRRADTASFIQCHVNAFDYLGGVPRRCLYDNAKVVTLGRVRRAYRVEPADAGLAALRLGFGIKLCQPYRAQTKGKVESGMKYVRAQPVAQRTLHRCRSEPSGERNGAPRWPTSDCKGTTHGVSLRRCWPRSSLTWASCRSGPPWLPT